MSDYFAPVTTPVNRTDVMRLMRNAWKTVKKSEPSDVTVRILTAQWGLETSYGKAGYCYNLGNLRTPSRLYNFTYYGGDEFVNGQHVVFNGKPKNAVERKYATFRAFKTPQESADAYVDTLNRLHRKALDLAGAGDANGYVRALGPHVSGGSEYYTDHVEHYAPNYMRCYNELTGAPVPQAGPVEGYAVLGPDPLGDPFTRKPGDPMPSPPKVIAPPPAKGLPGAPAQPGPGGAPGPGGGEGPGAEPLPVSPAKGTAPGSAQGAPGPGVLAKATAVLVGSQDPPVKIKLGAAAPAAPAEPKEPEKPRPPDLSGGRKWLAGLAEIKGHDMATAREESAFAEFKKGNIPGFVTKFVPIRLKDGKGHTATVEVSCDYFSVGSNEDYIRVPLSGYLAQRVADELGCLLPTSKLVLEIYAQAEIKLVAHPLDCMGTGGGWWQRSNVALRWHEDIISAQIPCDPSHKVPPEVRSKFNPNLSFRHQGKCAVKPPHPGVLVSGAKKEVIVSHEDLAHRLAFWGYFDPSGKAIQSGYGCRHGPGYADVSHGVRLVKNDMVVDGKPAKYEEVLKSGELCGLVIKEGKPYKNVRYPNPTPAHWEMGQ